MKNPTPKRKHAHQPKRIDPTIQFLALFNDIDKYFDTIVENPKFLPYNEKIKLIIHSNHPISHYVAQHEYLLKFFGEVRNHISHGIKLDGHSYTTPSDHAINKIKKLRDIIIKPEKAISFFKAPVKTCFANELCREVFPRVLNYTHLPIYEEGKLVGFLNEKNITHRCIKSFNNFDGTQWSDLTIKGLNVKPQRKFYEFVSPKATVHDILHRFMRAKRENRKLFAIFISSTGNSEGELQGIISPSDLAAIEDHFMHKVVD